MGILDHPTCLLRNMYAGQEATFRTLHEQLTGSKLGKEYSKAVYCHPVHLTYMQSPSCRMQGWMNHSWNQDCQEKYQQPQISRDITLLTTAPVAMVFPGVMYGCESGTTGMLSS